MSLTRGELLAMAAMGDAGRQSEHGRRLVAVEPRGAGRRAPMAYYVRHRRAAMRRTANLLADGYDLAGRDWYQRTLKATSPWWSGHYFSRTAGG